MCIILFVCMLLYVPSSLTINLLFCLEKIPGAVNVFRSPTISARTQKKIKYAGNLK